MFYSVMQHINIPRFAVNRELNARYSWQRRAESRPKPRVGSGVSYGGGAQPEMLAPRQRPIRRRSTNESPKLRDAVFHSSNRTPRPTHISECGPQVTNGRGLKPIGSMYQQPIQGRGAIPTREMNELFETPTTVRSKNFREGHRRINHDISISSTKSSSAGLIGHLRIAISEPPDLPARFPETGLQNLVPSDPTTSSVPRISSSVGHAGHSVIGGYYKLRPHESPRRRSLETPRTGTEKHGGATVAFRTGIKKAVSPGIPEKADKAQEPLLEKPRQEQPANVNGSAGDLTSVIGELWLDALSLREWLQVYLAEEIMRATRTSDQLSGFLTAG